MGLDPFRLTFTWSERLEAVCVVAVSAGLRIGEILGLRWTDVDIERDSLRVARTLSRAKSGPSFTTPKNGKGRSIVLTKQAVETLRSHRKRQNSERLRSVRCPLGTQRPRIRFCDGHTCKAGHGV